MELDKSEIEKHRKWLCDWRDTETFRKYVDDVTTQLGDDMLIQAGLEFARDSWIAAEFAIARKVKEIRLVQAQWPDFELRPNHNLVEHFEAVEADIPGRRRSDEYKKVRDQGGMGITWDESAEDWAKNAALVPSMLQTACKKKLKKNYGSKVGLVIYLNVATFGSHLDQIVNCFPGATSEAKDAFCSVWILWQGCAYLVWKDGIACQQNR